jgi:hypothetical protein
MVGVALVPSAGQGGKGDGKVGGRGSAGGGGRAAASPARRWGVEGQIPEGVARAIHVSAPAGPRGVHQAYWKVHGIGGFRRPGKKPAAHLFSAVLPARSRQGQKDASSAQGTRKLGSCRCPTRARARQRRRRRREALRATAKQVGGPPCRVQAKSNRGRARVRLGRCLVPYGAGPSHKRGVPREERRIGTARHLVVAAAKQAAAPARVAAAKPVRLVKRTPAL